MTEDIKTLRKDIQKIEAHLLQIESDIMEQLHLNRANQLCDTLKSAVINQSLSYPDIVEFENILSNIQNSKDFSYIIERLRRIKMLTNPSLMFDKQIKASSSADAILTAALSQYSGSAAMTEEDFNKNQITPLMLQHFNRLKLNFEPYFNELVCMVQQLASIHLISVDNDFAIFAMSFATPYPKQILTKIFDMLVEDKFIKGGDTEKVTFLSMFESTATAPENKITIIKVGRSKKQNISWLYVMFQELLGKVELSYEDKIIIATFFTLSAESLKPGSIKPRTESKNSRAFRSKLSKILN